MCFLKVSRFCEQLLYSSTVFKNLLLNSYCDQDVERQNIYDFVELLLLLLKSLGM